MKGQHERSVQVGRVVSDKMDKTVVVAVERVVHHRLYGKAVRKLSKFKAHSKDNAYHTGDIVRIEETRPLSADKRWRVHSLVKRMESADIAAVSVADLPAPAEAAAEPEPTAQKDGQA